jgi:anti-anti-sigma regulatory factor
MGCQMRQMRQTTDAGDGADIRIVLDSVVHDGLELTHRLVRGWHLVVVRGDLTAESGQSLTAMLDAIVGAGGQRIIVDLARAATVASECMLALTKANLALRAIEGDLRLVVDGVAVLHAIRAAGLSGRFEIHRYVGDIVGAVAGLDEGGRGKRRGSLPAQPPSPPVR